MDFFLHKSTSIFDLFQTTFQLFCRGWKTILSVTFLVSFFGFISGVGLGLAMPQSELKDVLKFAQVVDCFWLSIFDGAINEIGKRR